MDFFPNNNTLETKLTLFLVNFSESDWLYD